VSEKPHKKARIGRRALLKGAGAMLVLVAGGGVWRAADQGVFDPEGGPAFRPWKTWRAEEEGPLALVSAAILASNAHNTQPWIFRVGGSRIDLFADYKRGIGTIDPFQREMYIGLGCALENLLLAARAGGYEHRLTLAPDRSNPVHAARIDFSPGREEILPQYEAIPDRHTNRYPYDTARPVRQETLDALRALNDERDVGVFWFATQAERREVGGSLVEAAEAINADENQSYDNSEKWLRQDRDAIHHYRDGLSLDTMGLSSPTLLAAKMLPQPSLQTLADEWLRAHERQVETAAAFGIVAVRDYDDNAQRMRAGRLWQRMHLWMTEEKLAAQPMNQIHERADREVELGIEPAFGDALEGFLRDPSWRGTFTFRLGYTAEQTSPSPRRAARSVVTKENSS